MAAAMVGAGLCVLRRSSLLTSCNFLIHDNLFLKTGVLWKHPPSRTFFSDRKKFHTASVGQVFRLRPFHVLVATGGGYAGYRKYEDYKLEQLEKRGIEVPVKLASEWEQPHLGCWRVVVRSLLSLLQAKHAQYPWPIFIGHVLQPFGHAAGPSLNVLKSINTFLDSKKAGHTVVEDAQSKRE